MTNDMNLTLTAKIECHVGEGYVGWVESIKGLVVQAKTEQEAYDELITSVKVKLAFDWGIDYSNLVVKGAGYEKTIQQVRGDAFCGNNTSEHEFTLSRQVPIHA